MKNIINLKDMGKLPGNKKPPLDLAPFLARGFGDNIDKLIANAPVDGIDRYHTWSQVRLAPETADFLYTDFSNTKVKYSKGSRPVLENILDRILGNTNISSDRDKVQAVLNWVPFNLKHAKFVAGETPGNRALSEEKLLESGWGWCNEQARLFVSLAQIAGFPARMCSIYHGDGIHAHMTSEVFVNGKWAFADASNALVVELSDGSWAGAMEISWNEPAKIAVDKAYPEALGKIYEKLADGMTDSSSIWFNEPPHHMFAHIGISNYPVLSF